jgi:pyruvate-formate lyase-activating enzyme
LIRISSLLHCRYCANFTISQLQPLFKNKLINYVQLSVIPWGNARTDADGKVG